VHGNLTPANVLLTKDGLRVIDFGVAQEISTSGEPAEIGAVADNPGWLAPELLTGGPAGPACDVFGWGCVVTYAATGHSPHGATPVDAGALDEPVRGLVDAAVTEDGAGRPSAAELTARLADEPAPAEPVAEHVIPAVRPPRQVRSRAVLSALVAAGALLFAVPTTTEHRSAAPPPPRALGPVAPPKKAQPPNRTSNAAAVSVYDAPPTAGRGNRPAAPKATPSSPSHGKIWMSCSSRPPTWCSLSETPPEDPSGWQFSWTPGE
jgi:serine/threonine protein kinase